jgi:hypothetical protein
VIEAGNRLDLLATNNIVNKSGGIITGRDVNLTTRTGDVINERTITSSDNSTRFGTQHHDYADNAARIESANDLTVKAANDINITGWTAVERLRLKGSKTSMTKATPRPTTMPRGCRPKVAVIPMKPCVRPR